MVRLREDIKTVTKKNASFWGNVIIKQFLPLIFTRIISGLELFLVDTSYYERTKL